MFLSGLYTARHPSSEGTNMKTMHAGLGGALLLSLIASAGTVGAQEAPKISFQGQVRPRMETRSPGDGSWDSFTSMRVRAAMNACLLYTSPSPRDGLLSRMPS